MVKNNLMIVRHNYPKRAQVRFMDETYCDLFVKEGKVRLGSIASYREMEHDPRKDKTEGEANFTDATGVTYHGSELDGMVFILSFSNTTSIKKIKNLHAKFGCKGHSYIEIFDCETFKSRVKNAIFSQAPSCIGLRDNVYWVKVHYSGVSQILGSISNIPFNFHIYQKPSKYNYEQEIRLVLDGNLSGQLLSPIKHIDLVCGDLSDCVRIKDVREL